jgi:hypothetical protein
MNFLRSPNEWEQYLQKSQCGKSQSEGGAMCTSASLEHKLEVKVCAESDM